MKNINRVKVGSAPKKVKVEIPVDLQLLADLTGKTVQQILSDYINNLTSRPGNLGQNERTAAKEFFHFTMCSDLQIGKVATDFLESVYQDLPQMGKIQYEAARQLKLADRLDMVKRYIKEKEVQHGI